MTDGGNVIPQIPPSGSLPSETSYASPGGFTRRSDGGTYIPHRALIESDYPLAETLDRCVELAEGIEAREEYSHGPDGKTYRDATTLVAHLRVMREDLQLTEQSS